jgi:hypothetical protein
MYPYVFLVLVGVINERCERYIALSSVIGLRMYSPILGYSVFLKLTVGQVFFLGGPGKDLSTNFREVI